VNPTATELCDGLDNDCDGAIPADELDSDNDLYVECTWDAGGWDGTAFLTSGGDDCDDSQSSVNPGATEDCDGVDTDCDGTIPNEELDLDTDGFVECSWSSFGTTTSWLGTTEPTGGDDCDDNDFYINPGATEHCGGADSSIDYNCDGDFEAGSPEGTPYYEDADGDNLINPTSTETFCNDPASGWLVSAFYDCDDNNAAIGQMTNWYADTDFDGYGDAADSLSACFAPSGFVINRDDCDDSDRYTFPGAAEFENPGMCMTDADEDGWGKDISLVAVVGSDCDDSDAAINPDATEISNNSVDEDCDGTAPYTLLAVGMGMNSSCAVDDSETNWGVLHCWGADSNHSIVHDAPDASSYTDVAVGLEDACALDKNGWLTCWGATTSGSYATLPPNNVQYQSLSLGVDHGCALTFTSNGFGGYEVDCWGGACSTGECDEPGVGTGTELEWQDVAAGVAVSCGINPLGELDCWGDPQTQVMQDYASLGNTASFSRVALSTVQDVGCVLDDSFGHIECFGDSNTFIYNNIPGGGGFTDLSCGIGSCCALDSTSSIQCWGDDSVSIPSEIPSGTVWTAVSVGADMACAIDSSDLLTCWGTICSTFATACTGHP
jgi:hypothetical protein